MINLTIDGKPITVPKGTTVYNAIKELGIKVPIFCYHEKMPPFGACRVCLVEVEKMPKLQTSCTLEATDGMVIKTQSDPAVAGRKEILEFLLINHPLDCPICDRGGECPLQDQTVQFGPDQSHFYEEKRHFEKPVSRGPVLMLDRERCITCARCTRFGDIVSGDHALEFIERGYKTEVGTPDGGPAKSKYIGNTIMICPVGALTSQVYRFRARPWDNKPTESTCPLCPVGCSMILDSRDGEIMRTRSQENSAVNDIWLCDKGWFGYEFSSHPDRLQTPMIRRQGTLQPATWDEAISFITEKIKKAKTSGKAAGLGGNTLTTEENFLFQKLMREVIGVNHVDHRIGMPLLSQEQEGLPPGMEMSIGDTEKLSFAILLGCDLTEEFPIIWLRLKQAINHGAKVIFIGHYAPEISNHLSKTITHAPGLELASLNQHKSEIQALIDSGNKGALFVGRQYLETQDRLAILSELLKLRKSSENLSLNILEGKDNSNGARLAGMRPDRGPFDDKVSNPGLNFIEIIQEAAKAGWDYLHVAGADPASQLSNKLWEQARSKIGCLVVQDMFLTKTARDADVVLPTLCFVEKRGSFVNIENRIQKFLPGKFIPETIYSDAEIFTIIAEKLNHSLRIDAFFSEKLKESRLAISLPTQINSRSPTPQSNNNTMRATFSRSLFDRGVRMQHNPHLIQLAKTPRIRLHPNEGKRLNIEDGTLITITANGNTIQAKAHLDCRVAEKTVVIPLGFDELPAYNLSTNLFNGLPVEITRS